MLFVDGVEYRRWNPSKEEELQGFVNACSTKIFGEDSLYFPVKRRLKSLGGVGSIPDGYVIKLSKPYRWSIVEVELSSHPVHDHIVSQLSRFTSGIRNPESRKSIVRALYDEISSDPVTEIYVRKQISPNEIFRFLSDTIDQEPQLVIVIDETTTELEEACDSIQLRDKKVVEFKIFERTDAGIKNAFLFEPITEAPPSKDVTHKPEEGKTARKEEKMKTLLGEVTRQSEYTLPILEALVEIGGSGRAQDILNRVYEKMKNRLKPADLESVPSGTDIRWRNYARFERNRLKVEGYLRADSPIGIWEITEKGRDYHNQKK